MLHDLFQIQRMGDELCETWDEEEERDQVILRVGELRRHYFPSGDIPHAESLSCDEWLDMVKPCAKGIEGKIREERNAS